MENPKVSFRLPPEDLARLRTQAGDDVGGWVRRMLAVSEQAGTGAPDLAAAQQEAFRRGFELGQTVAVLTSVFEAGREDELDPVRFRLWAEHPDHAAEWAAVQAYMSLQPYAEQFSRWWAAGQLPA